MIWEVVSLEENQFGFRCSLYIYPSKNQELRGGNRSSPFYFAHTFLSCILFCLHSLTNRKQNPVNHIVCVSWHAVTIDIDRCLLSVASISWKRHIFHSPYDVETFLCTRRERMSVWPQYTETKCTMTFAGAVWKFTNEHAVKRQAGLRQRWVMVFG